VSKKQLTLAGREPILLKSSENKHKGRWVSEADTTDSDYFAIDLNYSLGVWKKQGIKVVWLSILDAQSALIPLAISQGFAFHHVSNNQLILTKRLIDDSLIPDFARHSIGAGGIVLNDNKRVLTIVEKNDMQTRPGHFKFPGGTVDKGEFIHQGVLREVFEETGVRAEFKGVVGFRHYHRGQFGTSNIYFVCHLQALSNDIVMCEEEIGIAQWIAIDDYLAMDSVLTFNKIFLRRAISNHYLTLVDIGDLVGISPAEYEIYL